MQKIRSADVEQRLADLTTDCIERMKRGETVDLDAYRNQLPDRETREEFDEVVSWSGVLTEIEGAKREARR